MWREGCDVGTLAESPEADTLLEAVDELRRRNEAASAAFLEAGIASVAGEPGERRQRELAKPA